MNPLDANRINVNSPYKVWTDGEVVHFDTDNDIRYAVDFDYDSNPYFTAYWLNLTNESGKPSPGDSKIPRTVICIIEEFFRQNPDIMLYLCSTAKDHRHSGHGSSCVGSTATSSSSAMSSGHTT